MEMTIAAAPGRIARSPGVKFFVLGFLAILLLIPLMFVEQLQRERSGRAAEAAREVAQAWGGDQTIAGPFIVLPYMAEAGGTQPQRRVAVFLPESLTANGKAATETLRRSIFDIAVYRGKFDIAARFQPIAIRSFDSQATQALWSEASLVMLISDVRGIKNRVALKVASGETIPFLPSAGLVRNQSGVHAPLRDLDSTKPLDLTISLDLNGSRSVSIAPVGAQSDIAIESNWRHPSFGGTHLPDDRRSGDDGFSASWRIGQLARSLTPSFALSDPSMEHALRTNAASVRFYQPVDIYQMVARALKYGVLFVGAVFLVVFALEMLARDQLHVAQYAMVGLALALFYVLLLSYAEHIGFTRAYLVSAGATIALVASYIGLSLRSLSKGAILAGALGVAYGLVYLLLRSEDYALLAGATAGFVGLALLMFATFRIDWSGVEAAARSAVRGPSTDAQPPTPTTA